MMLQFYKMTGSHHDFVMVDNRESELSSVLSHGNIADICNRRFGVGADGLIVVGPAQSKNSVCMHYYNADGTETDACDDALLCSAAFVDFLLDGKPAGVRFETKAGKMKGVVNADDSVTVTRGQEKPITGQALIVFCGELIVCEE